MYSDPFDLLELDRATATDADVRRAYAAKLKLNRPEDDRAAFMALRAAFEQARSEVAWREKFGPDQDVDDIGMDGSGGAEDYDDDGDDYDPAPLPEPIRIALAEQFIRDLVAAGVPDGETVRTLLRSDTYSGIDDLAVLSDQLRYLVCEQTGLFVRLDGSRIAHPALADWTQLWPFEDPVPHAAWPSWMTLGVMDELNREFQWTEELTFHHAARLQNEWVSQVIRELVWTGMPASVAVFNRFSAAIRNTYRWPDENVLMKLLKAGQADAPAEKSELSSLIQQLILEETQFGQRLIVSYCPRWLTSSLYDALDAWFGWTREARKDRYAIQQEKRRLGDLSRKRPANTPLHIRKAAWLEIVREESVWVRLPRHARLNRSRQRYADERASEGRMIGVILFLLIFFAVPIIAWIMSWGSA